MKKILLLVTLACMSVVASSFRAHVAPSDEFCTVLMQLYESAKETPSMKSIRGEGVDTSGNTVKSWRSNVILPVPGSDTAKVYLVRNDGLYECYLLSSSKKSDILSVYDKYSEILRNCLIDKGLEMRTEDNWDKTLTGYDKIIFQKPESEAWKNGDHIFGEPGRPKIEIEVDHSTYNDKFNVVLSVTR